jgi:NADH-quinone oxidoreductase subunit G
MRCAEAANQLRRTRERAGLFTVLAESNSYAAGLLSSADGKSFAEIVSGIEDGRIRALVVAETDLNRAPIDPARLEQALDRLEWLVVLDHVATPTVRRAHAFIPTASPFESVSTFVNQEGRVQAAEPVHAGGHSIDRESGGSHPPRVYTNITPGSDPKPAAQILAELAGNAREPGSPPLRTADGLVDGEALETATGAVIRGGRLIAASDRLTAPDFDRLTEDDASANGPAPGCLLPLVVEWTFGTEELSAYSPALQPAEKEPCLVLHSDDAKSAGLSDGDRVRLRLPTGAVELPLRACANMARGVIILPRHRRVPWREIVSMPGGLPIESFEKAAT